MPTSTPILGAARGAHGEQHDLEVGGAVAIAPLGSARPTKHVLLHLKGCAAAHATRAAHLTSSSPAPSGAPVRTRHRTTRAASRDPKPPRRRAASWGRGGDPAGALFMDVRPPKNSPRTSNVSTCRVRLSVMSFIVFCGVRFERGVGRRQSYFPPLGTMMARRADDPIPIERRPRAARRP